MDRYDISVQRNTSKVSSLDGVTVTLSVAGSIGVVSILVWFIWQIDPNAPNVAHVEVEYHCQVLPPPGMKTQADVEAEKPVGQFAVGTKVKGEPSNHIVTFAVIFLVSPNQTGFVVPEEEALN